jgi:hypothetical protein
MNRDAVLLGAASLATLFLLAWAGKVMSWQTWRKSVEGWLPQSIPSALVLVGMPLAEGVLATAILLVPAAGLTASAVFLLLLSGGLLALIPKRQGALCHCFGAGESSTIGPALVVRNLLLAVVSLFGATQATAQNLGRVPLLAALPTALALSVFLMVRGNLVLVRSMEDMEGRRSQ